MPDRIDLATHDDHRDAAQRAVAVLASGALVGLTVDGMPALLASATVPPAGPALAAGGPSPEHASTGDRRPATLLLPGPSALADWVDLRSEAAHKLPNRVWPGPVRLACPPSGAGLFARLPSAVRAILLDQGGHVAFQVPDDPVVRAILDLTAGPVVLLDATGAGWAASDGSEGPPLVLDSGPPDAGRRATVVRLDDEGWAVTQVGVVAESTLRELAGTILLFVCTGNTCRSPMAAATCRLLLAQHFGCPVGDLGAHGFTVESAGVGAGLGGPASTHALTILREASTSAGLDPADAGLSQHRSRPVTADLVRRADHILAMTWDHLDALLDRFPEVVDRVRLLDPSGDDIPDPYGSNETTYRATAQVITRLLQDAVLPILGVRPGPDRST